MGGDVLLLVKVLIAAAGLLLSALTVHARVIRLMVKAELVDFLGKLNGTYLRTEIFDKRDEEVERRLTALEGRAAPSR